MPSLFGLGVVFALAAAHGNGIAPMEADAVTSGSAPTLSDATVTANGGTTARKLQDVLGDNLTVKDFGATGRATGTDDPDDAPKFQAALDYLLTVGRDGGRQAPFLFVPRGRYRMATKVRVTGAVHLMCDGAILEADVRDGYVFDVEIASPAAGSHVIIEGCYFRFAGSFGTSRTGGVFAQDAVPLVIRNNVFEGLGKEALKTRWNANLSFEDNKIVEHLCAPIVWFTNGKRLPGGDDVLYLADISNNFFQHTAGCTNTYDAIRIDGGWNYSVRQNAFEMSGVGVNARGPKNLRIDNNFFERCSTGIEIHDQIGPVTIENNFFSSHQPDWSRTTPYATSQVAMLEGVAYRSLRPSNLGHRPAASPEWWATLSRVGVSFPSWIRQAHAQRNQFSHLDIGLAVTHRSNEWDLAQNVFDAESVRAPVAGAPAVGLRATQLKLGSILIDELTATVEWTKEARSASSGSLTVHPADGYLYAKSLEMSVTGPVAQSIWAKELPSPLDLSGYEYFVLAVKFTNFWALRGSADNDPTVGFPLVTLGAGADQYGFRLKSITYPDQPLFDGDGRWFLVSMPKTAFYALGGSPSWSNVRRIQLGIATGVGAYSASMSYQDGYYCTYGGATYRSRGNNNVGHAPDASPVWWAREPDLRASVLLGGLWGVKLKGVEEHSTLFDPRGGQSGMPDTSGATLRQLEVEVNSLKAAMRRAGSIEP